MEGPSTFAELMRSRRKAQGLSLEDLALRLGYRVRGLQKAESGNGLPRPDRMFAIADVLGISEDELRAVTAINSPRRSA